MKTINLIGSCVAVPIIHSIPDFRTTYQLSRGKSYDFRYRDKLSTSAVAPGKIAARLWDDCYDIFFKNTDWIPSHFLTDVQYQFDHVVKTHTIAKTIDHARLNDGPIYVDLMYEFIPSVVTDTEEFMIRNNYWHVLYQFFPGWFNEIVRKNIFQFDMFDRTMTMDRHHRLREAVETINTIGRPVVALGNVFTNKIFEKNSNCVVPCLESFNAATPFVKVGLNGDLDPLANYEYSKEQIDNFFRICKKPSMSPGWHWIDCEEDAYADPDHEWGAHPLHLHKSATERIGRRLGKMLARVDTRSLPISLP